MKATYRTRNGQLLISLEGDGVKAIFKAVSEVQDVFECDTSCGCCESINLQYRVRTIDDNDYYELACADCHAQLSFGQSKRGGLFPKRKDKDGRILPNRGWRVWTALAEGVRDATALSQASRNH